MLVGVPGASWGYCGHDSIRHEKASMLSRHAGSSDGGIQVTQESCTTDIHVANINIQIHVIMYIIYIWCTYARICIYIQNVCCHTNIHIYIYVHSVCIVSQVTFSHVHIYQKNTIHQLSHNRRRQLKCAKQLCESLATGCKPFELVQLDEIYPKKNA